MARNNYSEYFLPEKKGPTHGYIQHDFHEPLIFPKKIKVMIEAYAGLFKRIRTAEEEKKL